MKLFVCIFFYSLFSIALAKSELDEILKKTANRPQLTTEDWNKRIPQDFAIINDHALLMNFLLKKYNREILGSADFESARKSTERIYQLYRFYGDNVPKEPKLSKKVEALYLAMTHSHNLSLDFMNLSHKKPQRKFSNVRGTELQIKYYKESITKYIKQYGAPKDYKPKKY